MQITNNIYIFYYSVIVVNSWSTTAKENWNLGDYTDNILIVADPSNTED